MQLLCQKEMCFAGSHFTKKSCNTGETKSKPMFIAVVFLSSLWLFTKDAENLKIGLFKTPYNFVRFSPF
jgi:hypothetical protein